MDRIRSHRARRAPALIASLALFLLGSNYCLLGAWAGNTRMACMTTPGEALSTAVPACHHAAPASKSPSGHPAPKPSCCPAPVVAPSSPSIDSAPAFSPSLAGAVLAGVVGPAPLAAIVWHGHRPAPDGQPPTRLARAPLSARAPPLA